MVYNLAAGPSPLEGLNMEAGLDPAAPGEDRTAAILVETETPEQRIARQVASMGQAMQMAAAPLTEMIRRAGEAFQEAGHALGEHALVIKPFTASINLEGLKVPEDKGERRGGVTRSRTRKYATQRNRRAQEAARRRNRK